MVFVKRSYTTRKKKERKGRKEVIRRECYQTEAAKGSSFCCLYFLLLCLSCDSCEAPLLTFCCLLSSPFVCFLLSSLSSVSCLLRFSSVFCLLRFPRLVIFGYKALSPVGCARLIYLLFSKTCFTFASSSSWKIKCKNSRSRWSWYPIQSRLGPGGPDGTKAGFFNASSWLWLLLLSTTKIVKIHKKEQKNTLFRKAHETRYRRASDVVCSKGAVNWPFAGHWIWSDRSAQNERFRHTWSWSKRSHSQPQGVSTVQTAAPSCT